MIPIIDNKLTHTIVGLKHAYSAVTEVFSTSFCWERKNEKHLVVLFMMRPKRKRK